MIACPDCEEHLKRIDKLEARAEKAEARLRTVTDYTSGGHPLDYDAWSSALEQIGKTSARVASLKIQLAELHGDLCENECATHEECTDACSCVGSGKSKLEIAEARAEKVLESITGPRIHALWRDGMLAQGRCVSFERMRWDTLETDDQGLDNGIAAALRGAL